MSFSPLAFYARIDAGDWESVCAMYTPAACYERPGHPISIGRGEIYTCHSEPRTPRGKHVITGALVVGNDACVWGHFQRMADNGTQRSERFFDAFLLDHGLIQHRCTYLPRPAIHPSEFAASEGRSEID
ncbi:MAG: nuclear transport factor 2 family protein [Gemmatimonadota bacterium]